MPKKNKKKSAKSVSYQQQTAPKPVRPTEAVSPNPNTHQGVVLQELSSSSEMMNVQPEQASLLAHGHIQTYLRTQHRSHLTKNDLTAVLRLSQHLRVFGLLSAAAYVNQANAQGGEVRERTVPVWESLLCQLMEQSPVNRATLMESVIDLTKSHPNAYMVKWRKALNLSRHWNFWARAYVQQEEQ